MSDSPEAITCEVTEKEIARHDAVQFQGKWVGAEGKAILLERLRTGVDDRDSLVTASVVLRVAGLVIDAVIYYAFYVAIGLPTGWWMYPVSENDPSAQVTLPQAVFQFVMNALFILYVAIMQWRFGRTVGKFLSGTKVVCLNGSSLSMGRAFGRALCSDYLSIAISVSMLTMVLIELSDPAAAPGLQDRFQLMLATLSAVISALVLLSSLMALLDTKQHRALHDRIAGTRVVRVL